MINNFYMMINKDWLKNNPIPDHKGGWGQFDKIAELQEQQIQFIFDNSNNDNISILYKQISMPFNNIKSLYYYINIIKNIKNIDELFNVFIELYYKFNINFFISFDVYPSIYDSSVNILNISNSDLGLYIKEYYFNSEFENIIIAYKKFINDYLLLFNLDINPNNIFLFEKLMITYYYSSEDKYNLQLTNNIRSYEEICSDYPVIGRLFKLFLKKINKPFGLVNISNPKFLKHMNDLLILPMLNMWKDYLIYSLILSTYYFINDQVDFTYRNFYDIIINNSKIIIPKDKKIINIIDNLLSQDLSLKYIKLFYDQKNTQIVYNIITSIINVTEDIINNNKWMSKETIKKAIIKLKNIKIKIGYANKNGLYDYSKLILTNNLFDNIVLCNEYNNELKFSELYKKTNKNRWEMSAYKINAYYNRVNNDIVFPAGIIQPPFFFKNNIYKTYGGLGFIIAHEITHAFDNSGRLFDEFGNYNNWWTKQDNHNYIQLSNKLVEQFNNCKIMGEYINGRLTLGENIADLGGIKFAFAALLKLKPNIKQIKLFFYNFAFIFAKNTNEHIIKQHILTNPHTPNIFRVNQILKNFDLFYFVFNNISGDMFLEKKKRINIW